MEQWGCGDSTGEAFTAFSKSPLINHKNKHIINMKSGYNSRLTFSITDNPMISEYLSSEI